jgi:uncharacterized protein YbbC (DUF1343 family)
MRRFGIPGFAAAVLALVLAGCSTHRPLPPPAPARPAPAKPATERQSLSLPSTREVLAGIDVLEEEGFAPLRGKRVALLTHPAGADRRGVGAVEVLRHAPGVQLVALFATEHGIYDDEPAGQPFRDAVDPRTGLMVYSLYTQMGRLPHQPTAAQLKGVDALVIDLQDIGVRSYTFAGAMKEAMAGCFRNGVEVIVLDRPNPLGGIKVDGPILDSQLMTTNLSSEFPVPYVHGLTIGELARLAVGTPGVLSEAERERARLTVVPMRNWRRSMLWPDTGMPWIATSPHIPDFQAVIGYAMLGLGCEIGGFQHGVGNLYPFRGLSHKTVKLDALEADLRALRIPGIGFRRVTAPNARTGQPGVGLYVDVTDWGAWRPTELSFQLMRLACRLDPKNPFAAATDSKAGLFQRYMGSTEFFRDLAAHGARVDLEAYLRKWEAEDAAYRERSRRFWLYD